MTQVTQQLLWITLRFLCPALSTVTWKLMFSLWGLLSQCDCTDLNCVRIINICLQTSGSVAISWLYSGNWVWIKDCELCQSQEGAIFSPAQDRDWEQRTTGLEVKKFLPFVTESCRWLLVNKWLQTITSELSDSSSCWFESHYFQSVCWTHTLDRMTHGCPYCKLSCIAISWNSTNSATEHIKQTQHTNKMKTTEIHRWRPLDLVEKSTTWELLCLWARMNLNAHQIWRGKMICASPVSSSSAVNSELPLAAGIKLIKSNIKDLISHGLYWL